MDRGKRRVRLCLFAVVLTAVVLGVIYYYVQGKEEMSMHGTLVSNVGCNGAKRLSGGMQNIRCDSMQNIGCDSVRNIRCDSVQNIGCDSVQSIRHDSVQKEGIRTCL